MKNETAFLVIDVQEGMFAENYPVYRGAELLGKLRSLIAQAREAQVPVIYVQHSGGEGDIIHPIAPGWPIHAKIAPLEGETVVHKFHPDSFQDTVLQTELERLGVRRLVVAGIQTEFCVDTTCRRAYSLGYQVRLVQDAHSTWNNRGLTAEQIIAHHNETLASGFVELVAADEVDFTP